MATIRVPYATRLVADEALTAGLILRKGTGFALCDGASSLAAQAAVQPCAFSIENVEAGAFCDNVFILGECTFVAGATVAPGDKLICDTAGKVRPFSAVTLMPGQRYFFVGQALEAGTTGERFRGFFQVEGPMIAAQPAGAVLTETLTDARTLTVAECIAGAARLDPGGAGRNLITPTAALVVAAGATVGTQIRINVENTADAAEALTVVAGSGFTVDTATPTISQDQAGQIVLLVTNATASSEAGIVYLYRQDTDTDT